MTVPNVSLYCPRCGAPAIPAVAGGLCPACLLKDVAFGTGGNSFVNESWTPPTPGDLAADFPQLEILELIGRGGMGAVYKARQKSLGRFIALKILAPQHAANPSFAERFSREAQALAELNHPHIVTVHDFGRAGEFYFLLMDKAGRVKIADFGIARMMGAGFDPASGAAAPGAAGLTQESVLGTPQY